MRLRLALILGFMVLGGCDLAVPNGLFGCGQPTDCPSGYFCWNSDSRCYDSKEPECAPKTCEQVMVDFAALGIAIECGSLPDGCEGSIECGGCAEGSVCGANGQNFLCGCEENTCVSYGGGAQCGLVPTHCGGEEEAIFCGSCFGEFACVDNECVCPSGANCDSGCDGGEPTYPCAQNDCSPPVGLPDGCGGVTHCPSCANGDSCVPSEDLLYECLGDCTCEAKGIECGTASPCGSPTLCGTCADNGFEGGYHCEAERCVCEDPHEPNDSSRDPAPICVGGLGSNCMQDVWGIDVPATLHGSQDLDFYSLDVLDAPTPIFAQADGGRSRRILYLAYRCPDTSDGIDKCSGWTISIDDTKFCVANGDSIGIERRCDSGASSEPGNGNGTVIVGVAAEEFEGDCDGYNLHIFATSGTEVPVEF